MKNPSLKKFRLADVFDFSITTNKSFLTKKFVDKNKGDIPVYSAGQTPESKYGFIKSGLKNVKYFQNCLTWNIDGSMGFCFYRNGLFSLSEKVIPLMKRPGFENVSYDYLKIAVMANPTQFSYAGKKSGKGRIQSLEIMIPVTEGGAFDLSEQERIVRSYKSIELIKESIAKRADLIQKSFVNLLG